MFEVSLNLNLSSTCAHVPTIAGGFSGAAPIACGGGTIGDLFSENDRGSAMAIYAMGPLIGPAVGPVAGGYLTEAFGIKWVFVTIAGAF